MTEADLQAAVRLVAKQRGWREFRVPNARNRYGGGGTSANGWPDLTLVRNGKMLMLEFKGAGGELRPDQTAWLRELQAVAQASGGAVRAMVAFPADYDLVVRLLA